MRPIFTLHKAVKKSLLAIIAFFAFVSFVKAQTALNFTGTQSTTAIPVPALQTANSAFTVEIWMKPGDNGSFYKGTPVSFNSTGGSSGKFFIQYQNFGSTAGFYNLEVYIYGTQFGGTVNNALVKNAWNHVAAVVNPIANDLRIYVNGVLRYTYVGASQITNSNAQGVNVQMGAQVPGGENMIGAVDELRVWQGTRTSAEILANYNVSFTNPSSIANLLVDASFEGENPVTQFTNLATNNGVTNAKYNINNATYTNPDPFAAGALNFVKTTNLSGNYISVPHSSSLNLGTDFTIEAWVNYTGYNSTIIDKGNYDYLFQLNCNNAGFAPNRIDFYNRNTGNWVHSTGTVSEGSWHHVAITLTGGVMTFYIDGVAAGTASVAATQDSGPVNIGRQDPADCQCNAFNGSMDELRIWNRALSACEIMSTKDCELTNPVGQNGLAAYYQFNQGTANANNQTIYTLTDASGNDNTGTLQGFGLNGTSSNWVTGKVSGNCGTYAEPSATITAGGPLSFCEGGSVTLTASGGTGYKWYKADTQADLSTATVVSTSTSISVFTSGWYRVIATNAAGCSYVSGDVQVTVFPVPSITTITGNTNICGGNTTTLTASSADASAIFKWYNAATRGSLLFTGNTFTTPSLSVTTTYYVEVSNATCTAATRTAAKVTVNPAPSVGSVASQEVCHNGLQTTDINFTGSGTTYNWTNSNSSIGLAASGSGNIPAFTGLNPGNAPVVATITVTPEKNGCTGSPRQFTITVDPIPGIDFIPDQTVCNGSPTAAINITGPVAEATYRWSGGSAIGLPNDNGSVVPSFNAINTGTSASTTTLFVTSYYAGTSIGCGTSRGFNITVNPTPVISGISGNTDICSGTNTTLTASSTAASPVYNWYDAETGGNLLFTGASYTTPALTNETTYYVSVTSNGCASSARTAVTVNLKPAPFVNAVANQEVCHNGLQTTAINFTGSGSGTVYNWTNTQPAIGLPASGSGDIAAFTGLNPGNTAVTATIAVTPVNNGCSGIPIQFTITVDPIPVIDFIPNQTVCNGTPTTAINITGPVAEATYRWSGGAAIGLPNGNGSVVPSFNAINTGSTQSVNTLYVTSYYAGTMIGCGTSRGFNIIINPTPSISGVTGNATICSGTNTTLTASSAASSPVYSWYNAATGGTLLFTGAAYTTPALTISTTYYVSVSSNGCVSSARTAVPVTVNGLPLVPVVSGSTSVCAGSATLLTASSTASSPVYHWYDAATNGSLLYTGASYTTPALVSEQTYYVSVTDNNGCESPQRTAADVSVITINEQMVSAADAAVCAGNGTTIQLASSQAGVLYTLRNNADNTVVAGPVSGTGNPISFNTGILSSSVTYNVLAESGSGAGALSFNNGYAVANSTSANSFSTKYTVEAMINVSAYQYSTIVAKFDDDNNNRSWMINMGETGDATKICVVNSQYGAWINHIQWNTGFTPQLNTWYHIAVAFDASLPNNNIKLYVDGVLVSQTTWAFPVAQTAAKLYIGGYDGPGNGLNAGANSRFFNGKIGDVRLWNIARSQSDISSTLSGSLSGTETGLVAYYKMNDASGNTVTDLAGGNNATLSGNLPVWDAGNQQSGSATCSRVMQLTPTVTVNPLPGASISGTTTICQNGISPLITFTGTNGTAPYTFTYSINNGAPQTFVSSGSTATVAVPTSSSGNFTYTLISVKDASSTQCSNTVSGTATVTISPLPTVLCPANITVNNTPGQCGANVSYPDASVQNAINIVYSKTSGSFFATGSTPVVVTATDACGNTASCTFTVTVVDTEKPVFVNCPADIVTTASSASGAVINYTMPTATDNCAVTVTQTEGPASGSVFPIGTTTVTHLATDAAGNTALCTFHVVITGLAPAINCPSNITVDAAEGQCGAVVNFAATETTGIPASTIQYTENGNAVSSGSFFATGVHTITATATNPVGSSSCSFTITVADKQFPVLIGVPANMTVECDAVPAAVTVTASDNCSTSVPLYSEVRTNGTNANNYILTRSWSTTDASGNTTTASQVITVKDTKAPVFITVPSDMEVSNDAGICGAVVNFSASAVDQCGTVSISYSQAPGTVFATGLTTVTVTAADESGNAVTASFTIKVKDSEKPVITVPAIQNFCIADGNYYTVPSATNIRDNCGVVSVSYSISGPINRSGTGANASGSFGLGTSTVTWTVTDINGNTTTASTTVTVNPLPVASYVSNNADAFCDEVRLTGASNINPSTFSWSTDNTPGTFSSNPQLNLGLSNADGNYYLYVKSVTGCVSTAAVYNYRKQNMISSYTLLAYKEVDLGKYNKVTSGSVGVMSTRGEADFKAYSSVNGTGSFVKASRIDKKGTGIQIASQVIGAVSVDLPTMQYNTASTNRLPNYTANSNNAIISGNYKNLTVKRGVSITVTGNTFGSIKMEEGASIRFTATVLNIDNISADRGWKNNDYSYLRFAPGTSVRISNSVNFGSQVYVNPDGYQVTFYMGDNRSDEEKFTVKGGDTRIIANVYMPDGKLRVTATDADDDDHSNCDHKAHSAKNCPHKGHEHNDCNHQAHGSSTCSDDVYMTGFFIAEEIESKGNTVIWSSYDCSAPPVPVSMNKTSIAKGTAMTAKTTETITATEELKVTVMPNPTSTYFTLKIESRSELPVTMRVLDASGRVVDVKTKLGASSTIQIGHNYSSGMYYAELLQGEHRKLIQLIKIK